MQLPSCTPQCAGHFILEMEGAAGDPRERVQALQHVRELPKRATDLGPPRFKLTGLAVGDGLTDPATQVAVPFKRLFDKANQSGTGLGAMMRLLYLCHPPWHSSLRGAPSLHDCARLLPARHCIAMTRKSSAPRDSAARVSARASGA